MDSGTPGAATTDAATLKTATQRASVKAKSLRNKVGSAACQVRSSVVSATRVQRMRSLGLKDGGRHSLVTRSTTSPARCLAFRRASSSSLRGAASTKAQFETERLRPCRRAGHNLWRGGGETLQMVER